jgi:hypothetical protein
MRRITAKDIALTAVFAAVYIIATIPPWKLPVIGAPGAGGIEPSAVLGPVIGFILGPFLGFIAAGLGAFIGLILPPGFPGDPGGLLMPLSPAISAFVAGCLTSNSFFSKKIKGWMIGALTLFILIVGWYAYFFGIWAFTWGSLTETNISYIVTFPILHFTGLMIPLVLREKLSQLFRVLEKGKFSIPIFLTCWSALLSDHMLGSMIWITTRFPVLFPSIMPTLPEVFIGAIPIVLLERFTLTIVATIIAVALIPVLASGKLLPRAVEEA